MSALYSLRGRYMEWKREKNGRKQSRPQRISNVSISMIFTLEIRALTLHIWLINFRFSVMPLAAAAASADDGQFENYNDKILSN